jgi:hypothetical protein
MADLRGKDRDHGPKSVIKAEVETAAVLPKTLQVQTEVMPFAGAKVPMYAVYGRTDDDKRVWCATFLDSDEALSWAMASKTFGRPVTGAVLSQQPGVIDGTREYGRETTERPN